MLSEKETLKQTYKQRLQIKPSGAGGSVCNPPPPYSIDRAFFYNFRILYGILMKLCPGVTNAFGNILIQITFSGTFYAYVNSFFRKSLNFLTRNYERTWSHTVIFVICSWNFHQWVSLWLLTLIVTSFFILADTMKIQFLVCKIYTNQLTKVSCQQLCFNLDCVKILTFRKGVVFPQGSWGIPLVWLPKL